MATETLSSGEMESLIRFYADAGVDYLLAETPIDRFSETEPARQPRAEARPAPQPSAAPQKTPAPAARSPASGPFTPPVASAAVVPDEAVIADAYAAAASATTLDALRQAMDDFTGCNLRNSARNLVFGDGNPDADLMFVGEAPGREEDMQGLPFVGQAGRLLDRMLGAIGLDRQKTYITNMIPWRPPGNRTPTPHEIELCRPFIERHIELAAPKLLVFLGNVSTKTLLKTNRGILSIRGNWSEYNVGAVTIPVLPTLHPAYLLRNPAHKRLAWQDFIEIAIRFEALQGSDDTKS